MIIYNKLVRDKIPSIIESKGEKCEISVLEQEDYIVELKRKLIEEVDEYLISSNDSDATKELADILEVVHSLAGIHQKTIEEIKEMRIKKYEERGGFNNKFFLKSKADNW